MSQRTLIEINHDFSVRDRPGLLEALSRYLASGSRDDAEMLELWGWHVISRRHHADQFYVRSEEDGFPVKYIEPDQ